eukprot:977251-Rhodomonas_salina.3
MTVVAPGVSTPAGRSGFAEAHNWTAMLLTVRVYPSDPGWQRYRCARRQRIEVTRSHTRAECCRNEVPEFPSTGESTARQIGAHSVLLSCVRLHSDPRLTQFLCSTFNTKHFQLQTRLHRTS